MDAPSSNPDWHSAHAPQFPTPVFDAESNSTRVLNQQKDPVNASSLDTLPVHLYGLRLHRSTREKKQAESGYIATCHADSFLWLYTKTVVVILKMAC